MVGEGVDGVEGEEGDAQGRSTKSAGWQRDTGTGTTQGGRAGHDVINLVLSSETEGGRRRAWNCTSASASL